ncbi:Transcription initiation factor IIE subunit beta [Nymphaea thermarum]|nr:Transcription initiation factor IIE subunit beta [Nymphaea thermarum]
MDLKERLNKFRSQQEKCQSTLVGISAQATASKPKQPHRAAPTASVPQKSPVPIKFSNDTERLQYINSIRKSTAGSQVKRVIDLLFETRQAFTPEQINEFCYVDINANKTVFEILRKNIKVNYDGRCFSYKSKHDIKSKQELLVLIRKALNGVAVIDLKDAYPSVVEDLQELKAAGEVWLLSNLDSQEDIVYPNDPRAIMKVDDDIKQLFRGIELPRDMVDIEKDLQKNGMKPATNTAKRKEVAEVQGINPKPKQKKKREFTKRTKLTNAHLPELFQ